MRKNNALRKAELDIGKEQIRQIDMMYPAVFTVLWREYGWRENRIMKRLNESIEIWNECAMYGIHKSILEMLEEETGIEISISGFDKSFHELAYFSEKAYNRKPLNLAQSIYMRQQQKKWIAPCLLAGICLSLHRVDKWGADRLARFIFNVDLIRQTLGENPEKYARLMYEVTGCEAKSMWKEKK